VENHVSRKLDTTKAICAARGGGRKKKNLYYLGNGTSGDFKRKEVIGAANSLQGLPIDVCAKQLQEHANTSLMLQTREENADS